MSGVVESGGHLGARVPKPGSATMLGSKDEEGRRFSLYVINL